MSSIPDCNLVALITGSSGGIGAAVARRFAAKGMNLLLAYGQNRTVAQTLAQECRRLGASAEIAGGDLTRLEHTEELVATCIEHFSRLDLLIHCAGEAQETPLSALEDAQLYRLVNIHVISTIGLTRAALRPMAQQHRGRIVLLSSVAAQKPSHGAGVYAGCKGFIESFVRAMAVEVGRKGITVNAVAPGIVETDMTRLVRGFVGPELAQRSAARRLAAPDEIAAAIEFLSGKDGGYVNGHVMAVDGAYLGPP